MPHRDAPGSGADPGRAPDGSPPDKAGWRAVLLARRSALPEPVHTREAALLCGGVVAACGLAAPDRRETVCAYVPIRGEPGSTAMLDALRANGHRVLLPIVPPRPTRHTERGTPAALGWAPYRGPGSLLDGPFGLRQPAGPDLGPVAIADAGLVLVPALAVDTSGVRLGRGAGWYDRSLLHAVPGTALLAVVRDEELVAALPHEPHDVRMTGALTPSAGPRTFPTGLF